MVVTGTHFDWDKLSFSWSQISAQKPNIELINPNSKKMFFVHQVVNSKSTVYVFQLIVKDPNGGSDSANVKVNVVQKQVPSVKQQHKVDATSRLSGTINHQQNQPKPSNKINRKEITLNNNTVSHPTIFQGQAHILKDQEDVARNKANKTLYTTSGGRQNVSLPHSLSDAVTTKKKSAEPAINIDSGLSSKRTKYSVGKSLKTQSITGTGQFSGTHSLERITYSSDSQSTCIGNIFDNMHHDCKVTATSNSIYKGTLTCQDFNLGSWDQECLPTPNEPMGTCDSSIKREDLTWAHNTWTHITLILLATQTTYNQHLMP